MSAEGPKKLLSSRLTGMKFMQRKEESNIAKKLEAERRAAAAATASDNKWSAPVSSTGAPAAAHGPAPPTQSAYTQTFIDTTDGSFFDDVDGSLGASWPIAAPASAPAAGAAGVAEPEVVAATAANEISRLRLGRRTFGGFNAPLQAVLFGLDQDAGDALAASETVSAADMAKALGGKRGGSVFSAHERYDEMHGKSQQRGGGEGRGKGDRDRDSGHVTSSVGIKRSAEGAGRGSDKKPRAGK